MEGNNSVQGFKGITVQLDETGTVLRWLFMKQHSIREQIPQKPVERTLFVINVPPYFNENCFKQLFSDCGTVTNVIFHQTPNAGLPPVETSRFFRKYPGVKGYKVAYVVFESQEGLQAALRLNPKTPIILPLAQASVVSGIEKWTKEYNRSIYGSKALQREIDLFMTNFDKHEQLKKEQKKRAVEANEEGWILVTKAGRQPGIRRTESVKKKILEKEKVKRSKKELQNFYTFQIRESKMKNLETLRRKFEEDKKRLKALKQNRRFKPF